MEQKENILGVEKIGKLIAKFSIPCIIGMLVNSLYNIVDQIFIGWGIDYLANGATNVVFPLIMLCMAFSLMIGDGTSAFFSLNLGQKNLKNASKGVANGVILSAIVLITITALSLVFLPQLINLFGCTDALRDYALNYGYIIVLGFPFMGMGIVLSSIIRTDGNPQVSMISMVVGAILNIALDYVFIFVFKWGIAGAAIATVISQIVSFLICIYYFKNLKSVKLEKGSFKLDKKVGFGIFKLGISSFITQLSFVFLSAVANNLLVKYGSVSEYGAEIPITVIGIVMKITQILNSVIIGIAVGSQPIFGYNYGAGKFDRVKKTLKISVILSSAISLLAFVLFQTIPDKLILLFGSGNELYIKFACLSFRIYLMLSMFIGVQIVSGIFFQAIGKSAKSAFLSLSRQILFLIPGMFILGHFFGIMGLLYAGPVADGVSAVVAIILLIFEVKKFGKKTNLMQETQVSNEIETKSEKHIVITIAREYGSGGRYIGKLVAEKLGIKLYDKEFIEKLASETGLSEEFIQDNEQKLDILDSFNNGYYAGLTNSDTLFIDESKLIKELAVKESCVIIGRCADYILKDNKDVIKVFIYSNMEDKISRAVTRYGLEEKNAKKEINKINKLRSNHYKFYTGREWGNVENYDLCINSDAIGIEKTVEIICGMK